jgi:catechol 2,3-dioxygenase-like lactoylglutathione lyase family enzyme
MNSTSPTIGRIHLVTIPCNDAARSTAFYESLGFEKRVDFPFGDGGRWVELFPPDGVAGVALAPGPNRQAAIDTGLILTTDDIEATHARLRADGIDADAEIARPGSPAKIRVGGVDVVEPQPPMFHVRDPDGNALLVVQPAA